MPRFLPHLLLALSLTLFGTAVQAKPLRIIALSPHLTEMVYALGAGNELVGVISGSNYPSAARQLPVVGNYQQLNIEKILSLHPDLILSWSAGNPARQLASLRRFGIALFDSSPTRLNQLPTLARRLGQRLDRTKAGMALADRLSLKLLNLRRRFSHQTPLRVFYQIWHQPLITVNGNNWINDAIKTCGGVNVFAQSSAPYPQVNIEQVIAKAPQLLVIADHQSQGDQIWQSWPDFAASKHLIDVDPDKLNRFTPRLLDGIQTLCQAMQGIRQQLAQKH